MQCQRVWTISLVCVGSVNFNWIWIFCLWTFCFYVFLTCACYFAICRHMHSCIKLTLTQTRARNSEGYMQPQCFCMMLGWSDLHCFSLQIVCPPLKKGGILLYPTQRVAEGIMFLTRPSVSQSVSKSVSQSVSPSVLFFLLAQLLWNRSTEFRETL